MSHSLKCTLRLKGLRRLVKLGWEAPERVQAQWVSFDVALRFASLVEGSRNDRLEDTVGYDAVAEWISELCARGEYRLIEKLGYQAYQVIRERVPARVRVEVTVTKERPPIENLERGASFTVADEG